MLQHAFKEWAVICKALADGKQALILRKGGISEAAGEFRPEHERFWLYPTWLHQHAAGLKPSAATWLDEITHQRSAEGLVRLSHFVAVAGVVHVERLDQLEALDELHIWSPETIRSRFYYRQPGLYVLPVRVYRAAQPFDITETQAYAGCKTWVELEQALATDAAAPVLDDAAFAAARKEIERRLR